MGDSPPHGVALVPRPRPTFVASAVLGYGDIPWENWVAWSLLLRAGVSFRYEGIISRLCFCRVLRRNGGAVGDRLDVGRREMRGDVFVAWRSIGVMHSFLFFNGMRSLGHRDQHLCAVHGVSTRACQSSASRCTRWSRPRTHFSARGWYGKTLTVACPATHVRNKLISTFILSWGRSSRPECRVHSRGWVGVDIGFCQYEMVARRVAVSF